MLALWCVNHGISFPGFPRAGCRGSVCMRDYNGSHFCRICETSFKLRYRNHVCSFRNELYKHATELSKYIWTLNDQNVKYDIPGGVLKKVLYGEAPPRGPTPYPFIYHFFRKGTPFVYLLLEKGTPFTYLLKKSYE